MGRRRPATVVVMTIVATLGMGPMQSSLAQTPPPLAAPSAGITPPPCPSPPAAVAAGSAAPMPSADPCRPGSYLVDLANAGGSDRPDPGHYEGIGNVSCGFINGAWEGSLDHATPTSGPLVRLLSITQSAPPNVGIDTVNSTSDPGDWAVSASEVTGKVDVTVQDLGDTAIIRVHATDQFQVIDGWLSCSSVVRG